MLELQIETLDQETDTKVNNLVGASKLDYKVKDRTDGPATLDGGITCVRSENESALLQLRDRVKGWKRVVRAEIIPIETKWTPRECPECHQADSLIYDGSGPRQSKPGDVYRFQCSNPDCGYETELPGP